MATESFWCVCAATTQWISWIIFSRK